MDWIKYVLQGFVFGIAWVAPIGACNLFVINTSINNKDIKYILKTVSVIVFFDIPLVLACFIGVGIVFDVLPALKIIMLFIGSVIIIFMGIRLMLTKDEVANNKNSEKLSFVKTVFVCFSLTWLNPQALIEGTMLFGGIRASLPQYYANIFIISVCISFVFWFNIFALTVNRIGNKIKRAIKYINKICGVVLSFYGIKMGYEFIKEIMSLHGASSAVP
ncbi:MAG: LysE family transporter [Treponema sp.]|jgi:L-lysine exporter family protein LysE/ArgO|nr:LysE family transporter [Treponema sp.]